MAIPSIYHCKNYAKGKGIASTHLKTTTKRSKALRGVESKAE
jgi:hypothetical protein